jgi:hypothetical protein
MNGKSVKGRSRLFFIRFRFQLLKNTSLSAARRNRLAPVAQGAANRSPPPAPSCNIPERPDARIVAAGRAARATRGRRTICTKQHAKGPFEFGLPLRCILKERVLKANSLIPPSWLTPSTNERF